MTVPPLQLNGRLPPGEHHATIAEIITAFPALTTEHKELNAALLSLQSALKKLKSLVPDMILYIDGSFVSRKPSPNDIDLLFLTNILDEGEIQDFIRQECPIPFTYFDIHADPIHRRNLVNLFTHTRSNKLKGIIIIDL